MATLFEGKMYLSICNTTSIHVSNKPFFHLSLHLFSSRSPSSMPILHLFSSRSSFWRVPFVLTLALFFQKFSFGALFLRLFLRMQNGSYGLRGDLKPSFLPSFTPSVDQM